MNGYIGFYKGNRFETHASSTYDAQQRVADMAQALSPRSKVIRRDVDVYLAEKDGKQIEHKPMM